MADINSLIVYGPSGAGKTSLIARVMHDALWIVTRRSNLAGYHTWLRQNPEEAARQGLKPVQSILPISRMETDETGVLRPTDVQGLIRGLVTEYVRMAMSGETKVRGIVFDELSMFSKWVYDSIKKDERSGYDAILKIKEWVGELCEISAVTQLPMAFICHSKAPTFWDEGPKRGQLKYTGGPAMPVGTMIAEVCALPDAVLQADIVQSGIDSVRYVIRTQAHPQWERKCRVWGTPPEIEPDLRPLLSEAGWVFPSGANK